MKLCLSLLITIFFVSCSASPPAKNVADENKQARNKEIALKNEATELTRVAQKLDQQGRGMEIFRQAGNAENVRECGAAMADGQKQLKDYADRVGKLPDIYKNHLTPLVADLNECVSCEKKAMDGCRRARASINQAIKQLYP